MMFLSDVMFALAAVMHGWFLVLPDASDPSVNVYAEGDTNQHADALLASVLDRIEAIIAGRSQ